MKTRESFGATGGWRWTFTLLAAMAVGLLGVLLVAQGPAQAHDHRIPYTTLMKGKERLQVGRRVIDSRWSSPSGKECASVTTYYTFVLPGDAFNYPELDRVAAGAELRVRISKPERPDSFRISAYPKIDEKGNPSGRRRALERTLERTLEPVVRDGKTVAWDAVFSVERPSRNYYLIAEGHWRDVEGCGGGQHAHWSFHVKTRA